MRAKRDYTKASVGRALTHHETTGAITFISWPGHDQPKYRVGVYGLSEIHDLTLREAHVLCLGLAAAERHGQRFAADGARLVCKNRVKGI